jgi:hypothetical protein
MKTVPEHDPEQLYVAVQRQHTKELMYAMWWKVLGLPALLLFSWLLISKLGEEGQSSAAQIRFVIYSAPLWIVLHLAFVLRFDQYLQYHTAQLVLQMKALSFYPSGRKQFIRGNAFPYGWPNGYFLLADGGDKLPPPPLILGAITDYYQACRSARRWAHPGLVATVELRTFLGIVVLLAATLIASALDLGKYGGSGFSGLYSLTGMIMIAAAYVTGSCSTIRGIALLQALATVLSEPRP